MFSYINQYLFNQKSTSMTLNLKNNYANDWLWGIYCYSNQNCEITIKFYNTSASSQSYI